MDEAPPIPSSQAMAYLWLAPPWSGDVGEMRRNNRALALAHRGEQQAVAEVTEVLAGGVPTRLYRPKGDEQAMLVWLHGGGWSAGDLDSYDSVARALAVRAGCAVLSVDYRLAPEYPYPAALDDCWAVTVWAAELYPRIAIGGDSAGGNLAAAVALRARDQGIRLLAQLLVYPVLEYRVDTASYNHFAREYKMFAGVHGFGAESHRIMRRIWELYVPNPDQRYDPGASPMRATSHAGVAPAIIVSAEHDILRAEADDYANRLMQQGVRVDAISYEGQVHGFFHLLGLMDDARDAMGRSAAALARAFNRAS